MKIGETVRSLGPAIVVAAVVLGPGSILTSSRVGAEFGWAGLPVLAVAVILMIGMVALSARLGVVYERSLCTELAARLGRPVASLVALILFVLIALFQSSNNIALIAGLEPLVEEAPGATLPADSRIGILLAFNVLVLVCLYDTRSLYGVIERAMKVLVLLMVLAFLLNFVMVLFGPSIPKADGPREAANWLPLLAMVGTTFSVGGAFFQAYLVKEKGWGIHDLRRGTVDAVVGISVLGAVTAVILMTSILVFHRAADVPVLRGVGDVARQMEPLFGAGAKYIFAVGILAGAFSSFLVNAIVGGTVMADGLGLGSRIEDRWARHFTALALLTGMVVAIMAFAKEGSTVTLITIAQALTVIGLPALALALLYLATRKDLTGERKVPGALIGLAGVGTLVALALAVRTIDIVWTKIAG